MAAKRTASHSGAQATLEVNSSFEGNIDYSLTIFSDGGSPTPEHTGCSVTVESLGLTEDKADYMYGASSSEETDSETTEQPGFRRPYRRVLRVTKEGRRRLRKGGHYERITGSIRLSKYITYKASTVETPTYSLRIS